MTAKMAIYYDYALQAWIVDGRVQKCGHTVKTPGCYACEHAGEYTGPEPERD